MISNKYNPENCEKIPFALKGENKKYPVTFNHSSANPNEMLRIKISKLAENVLIIPASIHLVFNLEIEGHANNFFVNNINRNLIKSFKLLYGGETIQELQRYDFFKTYEDLFLPNEERRSLLKYRISSINMRKCRADAGDRLTTGGGYDANENNLAEYFHGNRYKVNLDHEILNSHGVFYPFVLDNQFLFELKICNVDDLVVYSDKTKPPNFKITNIELEYNCIISPELANYKIGKSFYYENTILEKTFTISRANDALINLQINLPRKSFSGILILFIEGFTAGKRDSERFVFPNLMEVQISVNGIPNRLSNKGSFQYDYFENKLKRYNHNVYERDFIAYKFGLWLDFKAFPDSKIHGSGLKFESSNGIQLALKRKRGGSGNYMTTYVFVVADAVVNVMNNTVHSIIY